MGDWVVTPRRGKAVEINALWYNALRLLEVGPRAPQCSGSSCPRPTSRSRPAQFQSAVLECQPGLSLDVVDGPSGDDSACRPNQLLAISLRHPVLDRAWESILEIVKDRLLTPVGLRSLAPGHPDYKNRYFGDLRAHDAAYHQGTVWAWCIGPFLDAWLKAYPHHRLGARAGSKGLCRIWMKPASAQSAKSSTRKRRLLSGCIAQAWSVAEVLRLWINTQEDKGQRIS